MTKCIKQMEQQSLRQLFGMYELGEHKLMSMSAKRGKFSHQPGSEESYAPFSVHLQEI